MSLRRFLTALSARLSRSPRAYRILLTVEVFTGDRIGPIGITPAHLTAWRDLVSHKNADKYLKALLSKATLPGQLYGLAGLYYIDPSSLQTLASPYLQGEDTVKTIIACFVADTLVSKIAERILDGAWPEALRRGAAGIADWY